MQCDYAGTPDAKKHMVSNLSTVAVVPVTLDVPLEPFTSHLCAALNTIGVCLRCSSDVYIIYIIVPASSLRLTSQLVQEELGSTALERYCDGVTGGCNTEM